jgi:hypothetical protein
MAKTARLQDVANTTLTYVGAGPDSVWNHAASAVADGGCAEHATISEVPAVHMRPGAERHPGSSVILNVAIRQPRRHLFPEVVAELRLFADYATLFKVRVMAWSSSRPRRLPGSLASGISPFATGRRWPESLRLRVGVSQNGLERRTDALMRRTSNRPIRRAHLAGA